MRPAWRERRRAWIPSPGSVAGRGRCAGCWSDLRLLRCLSLAHVWCCDGRGSDFCIPYVCSLHIERMRGARLVKCQCGPHTRTFRSPLVRWAESSWSRCSSHKRQSCAPRKKRWLVRDSPLHANSWRAPHVTPRTCRAELKTVCQSLMTKKKEASQELATVTKGQWKLLSCVHTLARVHTHVLSYNDDRSTVGCVGPLALCASACRASRESDRLCRVSDEGCPLA